MAKAPGRPFIRNTLAMVYDFDGTLTPQPMQEYTVLPELGITGDEFWSGSQRRGKAYRRRQHTHNICGY